MIDECSVVRIGRFVGSLSVLGLLFWLSKAYIVFYYVVL